MVEKVNSAPHISIACLRMRRGIPGPSKNAPFTSKPLCSCKTCTNRKCPNILDNLKIPTVDHTPARKPLCSIKKKGKKKRRVSPPLLQPEPTGPKETDSILGVLKEGRECGCDVVKAAATGSLHRMAGLQQQREAILSRALDPNYNPEELNAKETPEEEAYYDY